MKRTIVISLGGSLIIPEKIDYPFLNNLKKTLRSLYKKNKFIVVCGGGTIARKYIQALKKEGKSKKEQSEAGIRVTRMNAMFMMQFFGKEANDTLPMNMKEVIANNHKNKIVFCGALRWSSDSTSDTTAVKLANLLNAIFINITNVKALYTADPKTNPKAKLIHKILWEEFEKMAKKIKYQPGQHFILDQKAASLIKKHKIPSYIIGKNLNNLKKIFNNKPFEGTLIKG